MFAIISNNAIAYGPASWDAAIFSAELAQLGVSVSLPIFPPINAILLSNAAIVPVAEVEQEYDPSTQVLVPGPAVLDGSTVTVTWSPQALPAPTTAPVVVPTQITHMQALEVMAATIVTTSIAPLTTTSLYALTQAQMPNAPLAQQIAFEDAQVYERQSPTILSWATAFNLTSSQVDALFVAASAITE